MEKQRGPQLGLTELLGFLRSLVAEIDALTEANLRLKESMADVETDDVPKPRQTLTRSRVIRFADVPESNRITYKYHESQRDEKTRCCAAIRPWINGMGDRGMFVRCNGKADADSFCALHLRIAAEVGRCNWSEEAGRLGL